MHDYNRSKIKVRFWQQRLKISECIIITDLLSKSDWQKNKKNE